MDFQKMVAECSVSRGRSYVNSFGDIRSNNVGMSSVYLMLS